MYLCAYKDCDNIVENFGDVCNDHDKKVKKIKNKKKKK
jgi:hypothetical protein